MRSWVRRFSGLALLALLTVAACGGGDVDVVGEETPAGDGGSAGEPTAEPASGESGEPGDGDDEAAIGGEADSAPAGGGELCALGAEFEDAGTLTATSVLDGEEFFDTMRDVWARVAEAAPGDLQDEVEAIRDGFAEMEAALAQHDYDFSDPALQEALSSFASDDFAVAAEAFTEYMAEACGVELDGAAPGAGAQGEGGDPGTDESEAAEVDDPEIAVMMQLFGIDEDLARCLYEELGSLDLDQATIDPATMSQPVCGTTLLDVLAGAGG